MNSNIHITPEEWDIIESYLDQNGIEDETSVLKQKLNKIQNSEEKVKYVLELREVIEDSIRQSKIKDFHQQIPNSEKSEIVLQTKSKSYAIWYSIAAAVILFIGLFWVFKEDNTSEKIFASYFKPDIGLPLNMGTNNEYDFYDGMLDYKQGNYSKAIEKWQLLFDKSPNNDTLNYFLGVTYLAEGNAPKSFEYLEPIKKFDSSIFNEDSIYYVALANIKVGKIEAAKRLLKEHPSTRNNLLLQELKEL